MGLFISFLSLQDTVRRLIDSQRVMPRRFIRFPTTVDQQASPVASILRLRRRRPILSISAEATGGDYGMTVLQRRGALLKATKHHRSKAGLLYGDGAW
jgi:hypothetical protein